MGLAENIGSTLFGLKPLDQLTFGRLAACKETYQRRLLAKWEKAIAVVGQMSVGQMLFDQKSWNRENCWIMHFHNNSKRYFKNAPMRATYSLTSFLFLKRPSLLHSSHLLHSHWLVLITWPFWPFLSLKMNRFFNNKLECLQLGDSKSLVWNPCINIDLK
jgi:hypothetical protein